MFRWRGVLIWEDYHKIFQSCTLGTNTKLGYVTEVCVEEGKEKFVHTSDVEGPSLDEQVQFILDEKPKTIFCDGPMTYMLGFRYSKKSLEYMKGNNLKSLYF